MSIIIRETEKKEVCGKKSITLKDILASEIRLIDEDGEDLSQLFVDALPTGVTTVTLKASFDMED